MLYKCGTGKWNDRNTTRRHWYLRRKQNGRKRREERTNATKYLTIVKRNFEYNLTRARIILFATFSLEFFWMDNFASREVFETPRSHLGVLGKGSEIQEALRVYPQKLDNHQRTLPPIYGDYIRIEIHRSFVKWIKLSSTSTCVLEQPFFTRSLIVRKLQIRGFLFVRGWVFAGEEGKYRLSETDLFIAR